VLQEACLDFQSRAAEFA
jgi:RNA polymerase sigma-70 factor, ECF subfamily